jgi:predicted nucleic acid-binding protein
VGYLIDTNVASELRKAQRANPHVVAWVRQTQRSTMFLSVLVVGEIRRGIGILRRRDPNQAAALGRWLEDDLLASLAGRVVPVTLAVAEEWARLSVPDPLPAVDGLLAATARVHGLTLVTRNIRDFVRTGVPLLNPFEEPSAAPET